MALIPAYLQHLRSNGVSFHRLRDRGCVLDVVLAWRRHDPLRFAMRFWIYSGIGRILGVNSPEYIRRGMRGSSEPIE